MTVCVWLCVAVCVDVCGALEMAQIAADGNKTGGWPEDDHATFIALMTAYRAPDEGDGASTDGNARRKSHTKDRSNGYLSTSSDSDDDSTAPSKPKSRPASRHNALDRQLKLRVCVHVCVWLGLATADSHCAQVAPRKMRAFIGRCGVKLVGYSATEVKEHYAWWLRYTGRVEAKRRAVQAWRRQRAERLREREAGLDAEVAVRAQPEVSPRTKARRQAEEAAKRAKVEQWRAAKAAKARAEQEARQARLAAEAEERCVAVWLSWLAWLCGDRACVWRCVWRCVGSLQSTT